jgi:riboflavin transporter FmnP
MSRPGPRIAYMTAYTAIGIAIYYMLLFLPGVPVIGVPQIKMEIGAAPSPVFGVLLGPLSGFLAVLIGNVLKFLTTPLKELEDLMPY